MSGLRREKWTGTVRTVLDDIDARTLGYCQCHEHLFIEWGKPGQENPALCMEDLDRAIAELALYKSVGGSALADAQPVGCGRMAIWLREASNLSGVHIVASTGFHKLAFYPEDHWMMNLRKDELADLFILEIKSSMFADGNAGEPDLIAGCRAGVIKAALDRCGIEGPYEALFSAAATASAETGAPVLLHVEAGANATDALKFFTERRVPAGSLIFCHLDRADGDAGRHREIAQAGAFLEYDTIGRFKYHSDEHEIGLIETILAAGLEDHLLMSLDTTRERLKSYGGTLGLDYIHTVFIPKMRAHGLGEALIKKITIENPAAALALRFE
jgi:5-phospho-D-xylono-1,4-lactonase